MAGKANYPNPFAGGATSTCPLTCQMTPGPCYSAQSQDIKDITYGYAGLPTRMVLQVLDESCSPMPGCVIDVWHAAPVGKYSGDDPINENVAFCTGGDSDFTSHLYFRGKQTCDANGVCFFDTCFPGWYPGRTIHVHMSVSLGGSNVVTTQLFFDDVLDDEIIDTQPLYSARGARDTTNESDSVIAPSAVWPYVFETRKMPDGALLAWKTLVIRTTGSPSCPVPGSNAGSAEASNGDGGGAGG
jgi:protocatechuate 3,4-dioxygenase beta subunit